jgi:hypothetical protein
MCYYQWPDAAQLVPLATADKRMIPQLWTPQMSRMSREISESYNTSVQKLGYIHPGHGQHTLLSRSFISVASTGKNPKSSIIATIPKPQNQHFDYLEAWGSKSSMYGQCQEWFYATTTSVVVARWQNPHLERNSGSGLDAMPPPLTSRFLPM